MGVQGRRGTDRLRTIWTPEMDRYFIDLMLEQVRKGKRIDDHLFSKQAWKHMSSLFNAKFRFPYEKDVLKNRHKTLRNLYKAINNLLEQKGFSWDEIRQMVTADNKVWDDYIKVHPDARSYRIKTIPFYSDLCEIYKNTIIEGKVDISSQNAKVYTEIPEYEMGGLLEDVGVLASPFDGETGKSLIDSLPTVLVTQPIGADESAVEALHEIGIDEHYTVSVPKRRVNDTPEPATDTGLRIGTRSRTYWQPPMDRYFIDLMLDHVQKGNQIDGLFHKQAWMEMLASFNARFGFNYDVDILKNRYKTLRRQYNVIKNLLELDGFVWDDSRQMVTADDCVWQDYIKAHTDARQYMTRPVPYYKDLCLICREVNINERDSLSDQEDLDQGDEVPEANYNKLSNSLQCPIASFYGEDLIGDVADQSNKRQLENPLSSSHSKRAKRKNDGMASAINEMVSAVSSLAEKRKTGDDLISIESVIEAIQALPDMDEELVLDACDFLEDEKKAKTFLALDFKFRKKWLIRKLRSQQL